MHQTLIAEWGSQSFLFVSIETVQPKFEPKLRFLGFSPVFTLQDPYSQEVFRLSINIYIDIDIHTYIKQIIIEETTYMLVHAIFPMEDEVSKMQLTNSPEPHHHPSVSPESWKEAVDAEKHLRRHHQYSLAFLSHPSCKAVHPSYPYPTIAFTPLASSRKLEILFRHQLPRQDTAFTEHLHRECHVLAVDARG